MTAHEEMMAYFRSMPKKEKTNPYWKYQEAAANVTVKETGRELDFGQDCCLFNLVRNHFRSMYRSFHTEAQVLLVKQEDGTALGKAGASFLADPVTGNSTLEYPVLFQGIPVTIVILPQKNTPANSIVSEIFWQEQIAGKGIQPVARIHSHHILDAYQSATDYSTLNSNTLELVMGRIDKNDFELAYWLDEHGKATKEFVHKLTIHKNGHISNVQRIASGKPMWKVKPV